MSHFNLVSSGLETSLNFPSWGGRTPMDSSLGALISYFWLRVISLHLSSS